MFTFQCAADKKFGLPTDHPLFGSNLWVKNILYLPPCGWRVFTVRWTGGIFPYACLFSQIFQIGLMVTSNLWLNKEKKYVGFVGSQSCADYKNSFSKQNCLRDNIWHLGGFIVWTYFPFKQRKFAIYVCISANISVFSAYFLLAHIYKGL
jgi:hypothetical protein